MTQKTYKPYKKSGGSDRTISQKKNSAIKKLQNKRRSQIANRRVSNLRSRKNSQKKNSATKRIQSRFQGKKTRKNLSPIKAQLRRELEEHQEILMALIHIPKKSKKNFDDKIKSGNFRKLNLEGAKLSTKKLNGINLAYANLKNSFLNGTKFVDAKLVGADLTGAEIKNTIFENANLTNANFTKLKFTLNVNFINSNLTNARFYDGNLRNANLTKANLTNTTFNNMILYNPIFIDAILTKTNFINSSLRDFNFNDVYGNKLLNVNFSSSSILNSTPFESLVFDKCNFNDGTLNSISFTDIDFNNCTFNKTNLKISKFIDVTFNDCHFDNANMQQSNFKDVHFKNCKIDTTIFSGSNIENCIFDKCDLNGSIFSSFEHPHLTNIINIIFVETEMKNTKFDSLDLHNVNFNNIMLDGATFNGSDLTGSTFVGASLRGTNFYWTDLNRCNFTDAIMNEHTNFTDARGIDDNTLGLEARLNNGRAVDTHKAWANINMNLLHKFFADNDIICNNFPSNNETIKQFLKLNLRELLKDSFKNADETPKQKLELTEKLEKCFTGAINQFPNFFSPANSTTDKTIAEMLTCSINYIINQPTLFKNIYINSIISDIIAGHGALGMSCPKGAIERLISYIASSAHSYNMEYSENPTEEQKEKIEEYKKAIMIIENTDEIRLDGFRNEWFKDHLEYQEAIPARPAQGAALAVPAQPAIEAGPNAFSEDTTMDEKMQDYKDFLYRKFGLDQNLHSPERRKALENLIKNDKDNGVDAVRFNLENYIFYLGGNKRKYKRKYKR